ncbi:hypothetical protein B0H10DRAFT_1950646 [Mycena sp. CBHHK59/15]|nr:hypothetical protein B0H10DRAFT_1950646 [Mycena sp. CBHHK59/15]
MEAPTARQVLRMIPPIGDDSGKCGPLLEELQLLSKAKGDFFSVCSNVMMFVNERQKKHPQYSGIPFQPFGTVGAPFTVGWNLFCDRDRGGASGDGGGVGRPEGTRGGVFESSKVAPGDGGSGDVRATPMLAFESLRTILKETRESVWDALSSGGHRIQDEDDE